MRQSHRALALVLTTEHLSCSTRSMQRLRGKEVMASTLQVEAMVAELHSMEILTNVVSSLLFTTIVRLLLLQSSRFLTAFVPKLYQ